MAVVHYGGLVSAVSGAVGGVLFRRSAGCNVAGLKRCWLNQKTERELGARATFSRVRQAWRDLTAAERLEWNVAAENSPLVGRLGETRRGSGFTLFVHVAVWWLEVLGATPEHPSQMVPALTNPDPTLWVWPGGPVQLYYATPEVNGPQNMILYGQRLIRSWDTFPGRCLQVMGRCYRSQVLQNVIGAGASAMANWAAGDRFRYEITAAAGDRFGVLRWSGVGSVLEYGAELVVNTSFEDSTGAPVTTGWVHDGGGSWEVEYPDAALGSCYADLLFTAYGVSGGLRTFRNKTIVAGHTYRVAFALRNISGVLPQVVLTAYGGGMTVVCTTPAASSTDWTFHEYEVTPSWSSSVACLLFQTYGSSNIHVNIDAASWREVL